MPIFIQLIEQMIGMEKAENNMLEKPPLGFLTLRLLTLQDASVRELESQIFMVSPAATQGDYSR